MTNPVPTRRWFCPTPGWLILALLVLECLLLLSERFQWFGFNSHKGWTVLIAVASVGVVFIIMLLWFIVSLLFRWRFQFSIRSLLVLVVVMAIPCSWLATQMKNAGSQKETVAWIRGKKGSVYFDYELDDAGRLLILSNYYGKPQPVIKPVEPEWLRHLLGDDLFVTVADADMRQNDFSDADLDRLNGLPGLRILNLSNNTSITDAGLEYIGRLTQLRGLSLSGTNVTDAGLRHLDNLRNLEQLGLPRQATDAGLASIQNLTRLTTLSVEGGAITDAGTVHLRRLKELRELILWFTQITDVGLENLEGLQQLQELLLNGTQITDAGLKHLRTLSNLRILRIDGTNVTDAGLESLEGLANLEHLNLGGTKVTDNGLPHLAKLTQLQVLDFEGCPHITDAGLVHLRGLTNLNSLCLASTSVTDAGVEHLKGLTRLTSLGTGGTRVTDKGWSALRAAIPNCGFSRYPPDLEGLINRKE